MYQVQQMQARKGDTITYLPSERYWILIRNREETAKTRLSKMKTLNARYGFRIKKIKR